MNKSNHSPNPLHCDPINPALIQSDPILKKVNDMMEQYWQDYPDLYQCIQAKRIAEAEKATAADVSVQAATPQPVESKPSDKIWDPPLSGASLRQKCYDSHRQIRQSILETGSEIIPRTQAHNRKCDHKNLEAEQAFRGEVVQEQLRAWRRLLPQLLRRFSKLPDYRQAKQSQT